MTAAEQRRRAISLAKEVSDELYDNELLTAAALRLYAAMVDPQEGFVNTLCRVVTDSPTETPLWAVDVRTVLKEALRLVDAPPTEQGVAT